MHSYIATDVWTTEYMNGSECITATRNSRQAKYGERKRVTGEPGKTNAAFCSWLKLPKLFCHFLVCVSLYSLFHKPWNEVVIQPAREPKPVQLKQYYVNTNE